MKRSWVFGLAALAGLIVLDRTREAGGRSHPGVPASAPTPRSRARTAALPAPKSGSPVVSLSVAAPEGPGEAGGTPAIDLLARLEARRRLGLAAGTTYFDSLFAETDSVVRRWSEPETPLVVGVAEASPPANADAALVETLKEALRAWEQTRPALRFVLTRDTAAAQIRVRSEDQLEGERIGLTDLEWTRNGAIHLARIALARRDHRGSSIPPTVALAVAIHEIGHALGLAHSPSPGDVMFPATRTARLSPRDERTVELLYQLPLGSVREGKQ